MCLSDDGVNDGFAQDHIPRLLSVRNCGQTHIPRLAAYNSLVVIRHNIQRRFQSAGGAIDRRGCNMFCEAVPPMAKIAGSQESNSLVGERLAKVHSDTGDIGDITTPRLKIGFIAIQSPFHRDWFTVVTIAVSANASNSTSAVLRLPEIEGIVTVGLFIIVGVANRLRPVATLTVSHPQHPGAGSLIAAVSQADARS